MADFSGSGTLVVGNHQYTVPNLVAPGEQVYSSVVTEDYEAWDGNLQVNTANKIIEEAGDEFPSLKGNSLDERTRQSIF